MPIDNTTDPTPPYDPKSPYWDGSHPGHRDAVAQVTRRFEAQEPHDLGGASPYTDGPGAAQTDAVPAYNPKHPYYDANHPDHRQAVADVARAMREQHDEPRTDENRGEIQDLRAAAGVRLPEEMPPHIAESWDVLAEGDVLQYAVDERIPPSTVQHLMNWYVSNGTVYGINAETEARFRSTFAATLTPKQIDTYIRWARAFHGYEDS